MPKFVIYKMLHFNIIFNWSYHQNSQVQTQEKSLPIGNLLINAISWPIGKLSLQKLTVELLWIFLISSSWFGLFITFCYLCENPRMPEGGKCMKLSWLLNGKKSLAIPDANILERRRDNENTSKRLITNLRKRRKKTYIEFKETSRIHRTCQTR